MCFYKLHVSTAVGLENVQFTGPTGPTARNHVRSSLSSRVITIEWPCVSPSGPAQVWYQNKAVVQSYFINRIYICALSYCTKWAKDQVGLFTVGVKQVDCICYRDAMILNRSPPASWENEPSFPSYKEVLWMLDVRWSLNCSTPQKWSTDTPDPYVQQTSHLSNHLPQAYPHRSWLLPSLSTSVDNLPRSHLHCLFHIFFICSALKS